MTNEEMVVLIQQGQTELYSDLWKQVGRLIGKIVLSYAKHRILPPDISKEDLLQSGYFAMMAAVKAYDDSKSYKFNTYLDLHVRNAVNITINHGRRVGQNIPTIKEYSYNEAIAGDDGEETEFIDLMQDESTLYEYEQLEVSDLQAHVWQAVADLPDRQQEVIRRYYLQGTSLTDIAKEKGVAVSNIQQRKNQGLQMLRKSRDLRTVYKDYIRNACPDFSSYDFYWLRSPEKYVIEKDIHERRQQGEYISYGNERAIITAAKAEYLKQAQEQRHRYRA